MTKATDKSTLTEDLAFHLLRNLPRLDIDNDLSESVLTNFQVQILNNNNTVRITTTTPHNLVVNDSIFVKGIKYKYAINKLEVVSNTTDIVNVITQKNVLVRNNIAEIQGVTTDNAYNGVFDIAYADSSWLDAFDIYNNNNITTKTINNEGFYLMEHCDDDYYYCCLNGSKAVSNIIDANTFEYSIDENDPYYQWMYKNEKIQLTKPDIEPIDVANAVIQCRIKIITTLDLNRALDYYKTQGLKYPAWNRRLCLFISRSRGIESNSPPATLYQNNEDPSVSFSYNIYYDITLVCKVNNELLSGTTIDYFDTWFMKLQAILFGRQFRSMFKNHLNYYSSVAFSSNEWSTNQPVVAYMKTEFAVSGMMQLEDMFVSSTGVPIKQFEINILNDEDIREKVVASGSL